MNRTSFLWLWRSFWITKFIWFPLGFVYFCGLKIDWHSSKNDMRAVYIYQWWIIIANSGASGHGPAIWDPQNSSMTLFLFLFNGVFLAHKDRIFHILVAFKPRLPQGLQLFIRHWHIQQYFWYFSANFVNGINWIWIRIVFWEFLKISSSPDLVMPFGIIHSSGTRSIRINIFGTIDHVGDCMRKLKNFLSFCVISSWLLRIKENFFLSFRNFIFENQTKKN